MKYITLKDMGSSGGLCSQLQIFSGLKAVAKANNMKIVFSKEMIEGKSITYPPTGEPLQTRIRIFDLLDLKYELKPNSFFNDFKDKHIDYHTTRYDKTLFNLDPSFNYNLIGRFDTYTYWYNDIKEEVESWKYQKILQEQADKRMDKIKNHFNNNKPTVSVHFRRGDYLLPQFSFCILNNDYYLKAITKNFKPINDYNFIVFSNDIEYSKSVLEGDNIWFVDPKGGGVCTDSEKEDLVLMSLCDHHIISNSSYSWWGAFLSKNPNKKIICPTNWIKSTHSSSWMNGNYFPPNWININNKN
tara:strand:- start:37 stop:936 length:900 start_codon:yes stop_codon:yes gene_type:complete